MKIINYLSLFSNEIPQKMVNNLEKAPEFNRYLGGIKGARRRKSITGGQLNEVGDHSKADPESLKLEK